mgnify:CR=1 FL=1
MANDQIQTSQRSSERKKILLICRQAPYGSTLARAALDVALAGAAFEQDLSLLFMDDGVWQLLPQQRAGAIGHKSIEATLQSLPLYDLDTFHVEGESLQQRSLETGQLSGNVVVLTQEELPAFIDSHDQVIGF